MSEIALQNDRLSKQLAALSVMLAFIAIVLLVTVRHYTTGVQLSTILSISALAVASCSIILKTGLPFYE